MKLIEPVLRGDTFVADVYAARDGATTAAGGFHLWWLGQSGFLIHYLRRNVLLDPYLSDSLTFKYASSDKPHVRMSARVVRPEQITDVVLVSSSHNHTDHLDPDTLRPLFAANVRGPVTEGWRLRLVLPEANRQFAAERLSMSADDFLGMDSGGMVEHDGFTFSAVPSAHEALDQDEVGRYRYLGYVVQFGPWTVYHSGDTVLYDGMVERLRPFNIDVALLPINGRAPERRVAGNLWGREAAWLAKEIGAKLVIPCHYDMFEFNTATPDEFVAECERLGQPYRVLRQGERWSSAELTA